MRAETSTIRIQPKRIRKEERTELLALTPRNQITEKAKPQDQNRSPVEASQESIEAYLPLVRLVAERIHRRLPAGIDLDSLINSGIVGLMEALQRYDFSRGVTFHTYAHYRIQGEIIEYLRSLDWVSRSVRAWGRKMVAARNRLEGWLGREASPEEMAAELHISLEEYYRVTQKVSEATLFSLEDLLTDPEGECGMAQEAFCHNPFQDPLAVLEKKDLVEKLTAALETLSERERLVVTLYYYEELTLKEIGEVLGLTEGRICQIHAQAVSRLRPILGARTEKQFPTIVREEQMACPSMN